VFWSLVDGVFTLISRRRIEAKRRKAKQAISLVVVSRTDYTKDLFSVVLAHPKGKVLPAFDAGQYLTLLVPINNDQKSISRRYSLAHWQKKPKEYHLGIRRVHDGQLSSWMHQHLQIGHYINVLPPAGHFTLQEAMADIRTTDIVLIGAGIGITPVTAMLEKLRQDNKHVHLFHSAREEDELIWCEQFKDLAQSSSWFSYYPYLSKPSNAWSGLSGRVHVDDLIKTGINLNSTHFFMCAKLEMMQEIESLLIEQGVPCAQVHWESFGSGNTNNDQQSYQVSIDGHGDYTFSGESSLLHAMESWNIPIDADCRAGDCGECQIKIVNGQCKSIQPITCQISPENALACCIVPSSNIKVSIL
jgi:ferredoxin-NADP reductase